MPALTHSASTVMKAAATARGRLVLCFDGTGNDYQGDTSDTNIVKLYKMFDRNDDKQWHYYQPGIGTYTADTDKINIGPLSRMHRSFSQTMDEGFGTSFDQHVLAGYKFLMRYYDTGDQIYIFGFSRGAFTARFLARMVATVGLLSKGNEEMISFAYSSYQDYEQGTGKRTVEQNGEFFRDFRETFCRSDVMVHFLGLFDTVRSVGNFDNPFSSPAYIPAFNTYAKHVRHAVAVDECRAKFKPALLGMDGIDVTEVDVDKRGEVKEVWFPGNHGDIGGGWPIEKDKSGNAFPKFMQLSSRPLEWMLNEIKALPIDAGTEPLKLSSYADDFLRSRTAAAKEEALKTRVHNVLKFGGGCKWYKVLFWNFMEYLPFRRRTLTDDKKFWKSKWWPNMGGRRPIPHCAVLDETVHLRMGLGIDYKPDNEGMDVALSVKSKTQAV